MKVAAVTSNDKEHANHKKDKQHLSNEEAERQGAASSIQALLSKKGKKKGRAANEKEKAAADPSDRKGAKDRRKTGKGKGSEKDRNSGYREEEEDGFAQKDSGCNQKDAAKPRRTVVTAKKARGDCQTDGGS